MSQSETFGALSLADQVGEAVDMRANQSPCRRKIAAELYLRAYWRYYVLAMIWATATVLLGPGWPPN